MEIGISTACFYPEKLEDIILKINNLGFSCIEVFLNTDCELKKEFLNEQINNLKHSNIRVHSVHPFTSQMETLYFFSVYEKRIQDGIILYERYFEAMNLIGASVLTFHGGKNITALTPDKYAKNIYPLLNAAAKKGIVIAQENVFDSLCANPDYIYKLRKIMDQSLKFTLDIKQANKSGFSPFTVLESMGDDVVNIHLNDFDQDNLCLLPGVGTFELEKFIHLLKENKIKVPLILEVYRQNYHNLEDILLSRSYLAKLD